MSSLVTFALGHKFPFKSINEIADYCLSPVPCSGATRLLVIPDERLGVVGQSLSEYSQLFWLAENIRGLAPEATHVRIVHYRRFCSTEPPDPKFRNAYQPWASMLGDEDARDLLKRQVKIPASGFLFNTPATFGDGGVLKQYAQYHELEDLLLFASYLTASSKMSKEQVIKFLTRSEIVPSCNIGTFPVQYFVDQMVQLGSAAEFMFHHRYINRAGYQRRNMGYLMERLQSHLIIDDIENQRAPFSFGSNVILSEDPASGEITGTDKQM